MIVMTTALLLLAQATPPQSAVPAWLAILLAAAIPLAAGIGKKVGTYLVTSGEAYVTARLKAAKHDELVPVVEALAHGLLEGAHDASLDAAVQKAADNGSIDHPVIQRVIATGGTS